MSDSLRIDKWLWYARFFKSRTLAGGFVAGGRLRLNGEHVSKTHQAVRAGDILTFPLGPYIRVIRIVELGTRRGPAAEAQSLYEDLDPPQPRKQGNDGHPAQVAWREPGSGRPTKVERRATDRLRGRR
ncbi:MAG: RNA-binding S4 domain-containing protein [Rhodospirillales bacterium]